jgi:dihydrofolate synthase/folylpolyglutamate synthase
MDPLDFLFSLERLGMKFGLDNIAALCGALGHPERTFRAIVIAGTNGKGSVTVMVETALRAAGYRTARYTSPHAARSTDRRPFSNAQRPRRSSCSGAPALKSRCSKSGSADGSMQPTS